MKNTHFDRYVSRKHVVFFIFMQGFDEVNP